MSSSAALICWHLAVALPQCCFIFIVLSRAQYLQSPNRECGLAALYSMNFSKCSAFTHFSGSQKLQVMQRVLNIWRVD